MSGLKKKAHDAVYKILNDPIAQRHVILQKYCLQALDSSAKDESKEVFGDVQPITDLCLIPANKPDDVPNGYEVVQKSPAGHAAHILKASGSKYLICFRRSKPHSHSRANSMIQTAGIASFSSEDLASQAEETPGNDDGSGSALRGLIPSPSAHDIAMADKKQFDRSAISDIRIVPADQIPFGYEPLLTTYKGKKINSQLVICYSRHGLGQIKHIAVIHPPRGEKVPTGYLLLKTNLNDGDGQDGEDAFICCAKDLSQYFATLDEYSEGNDPKYIPPLLTACHILEPVIGTVAVLSLDGLVVDGYFKSDTAPELSRGHLSAVIVAVCDALATSFEPNFQKALVHLLKGVLKHHMYTLGLDDVFEIATAAFRVVSQTVRNNFLESFADLCMRLPQESKEDGLIPMTLEEEKERAFESVIINLVHNVTNAKLSAQIFRVFQNTPLLNQRFRPVVSELVHLLFDNPAHRRLGTFMLVMCKMVQESELSTVKLKYKYGLARKHSALHIIQRLLTVMVPPECEEPNSIFSPRVSIVGLEDREPIVPKSGQGKVRPRVAGSVLEDDNVIVMDRNFAFLMRRAMVTTLCQALVPRQMPDSKEFLFPDMRTFRHALSVTALMWRHHPQFFKIEIGTLLSEMFLETLGNHRAPFERRLEILMMLHDMLDGSQRLADMYYNFDNIDGWGVFEKLVETLAKVIEEVTPRGDDAAHIRKVSNAIDASTDSARNRGVTLEFESTTHSPTTQKGRQASTQARGLAAIIAGGDNGQLQPNTQLLIHCIELIVTVLRSADRWHAERAAARQEAEMSRLTNISPDKLEQFSADEKQELASMDVENLSNDDISKMLKEKVKNKRKGTVMQRAGKQKADKKILEKAIRIAKQKSVAKMIAHLEGINYLPHDAQKIVEFVHRLAVSAKLDKESVGEFLGGKRPRKEAPFEDEIRIRYIRRLHLTNVTMEEALRRFLTQSFFRLPPEAQKIERLLECFAFVYCEENPDAFDNEDAAFVMANAILMLNTSLHNPNLKDKDRMKKKAFINMCSAVDGSSYTREQLGELYNQIKKEGYEIELTRNVKQGRTEGVDDRKEQTAELNRFVNHTKITIRKSLADLKHADIWSPGFYHAQAEETILSMFEPSWYQFMAILSSTIEHATDTHVVTACMDGFKYSIRLCSRLNMTEEKNSLGGSLARFTYIFTNALSAKPKDSLTVTRDLVTGKHLNVAWLKLLKGLPDTDASAVDHISECIEDIKKKYIRETNFKVLREIQSKLDGNLNVVSPGRFFIREGSISKLNAGDGEVRRYRLFLFSDSVLYASASGQLYKPRRVILLAFSECIALKDKGDQRNRFRISSPQKIVTFEADTAASRDSWVQAINKYIIKQKDLRQKIIEVTNKLAAEGKYGIQQKEVVLIQNSAAFLGKDPRAMMQGELTSQVAVQGCCPLSMTKYSLFNSRSMCKLCQQEVCSKCISHKVTLPATRKRSKICDGCFGLSKEYDEFKRETSHSKNAS